MKIKIKIKALNILALSLMLFLGESIYAQKKTYNKIVIVSVNEILTAEEHSNLGIVSNVSSNLRSNNNESVYYNPCYFNLRKEKKIPFETYRINFPFKGNSTLKIDPSRKSYEFEMMLDNLNSDEGYRYSSVANSKKKMTVDNIFWGFVVNIAHKGINESITIWLRKNTNSFHGVQTNWIEYSINDEPFKKEMGYEEIGSPLLKIHSNSGKSTISWRSVYYELPYFIDEINNITILVGCQAKTINSKATLKFGDLFVRHKDILERHNKEISYLLDDKKYFTAKKDILAMIFENGKTYELNAVYLAICQLKLDEFNDCISTCDAIIQYRGDYYKQAYLFRGLAKEYMGNVQGALSDYSNAREVGVEQYNRLNQTIKKVNNTRSTQLRK